ncbi:mitochondrial carrier [Meredithblackwellia eburnea MCA 4105]
MTADVSISSVSSRSLAGAATKAVASDSVAHHHPKFIFSWSRNSTLPMFPKPDKAAFIAGALAGAASRTVVSPLERLKIIYQVQPASHYKGIMSSLVKMWKEEGFRGYMSGNGVNVLRIAPYSAVQFSTYEFLKGIMASTGAEIDTPRRLIAGSLAGIASVISTYPLDLVRARLSIESAHLGANAAERGKKATSIWAMTVKVYMEEGGVRGLYRGMVPTAAGVAPYVALNFATYEIFKAYLTTREHAPGTFLKLCCGALAGSISQTLTYPLDVLRRRMQVVGMSSMGYNYKNGWDAIFCIIRQEGLRGLYKGIIPNLLKVGPSIGTSFAVYEFSKDTIERFEEGRD